MAELIHAEEKYKTPVMVLRLTEMLRSTSLVHKDLEAALSSGFGDKLHKAGWHTTNVTAIAEAMIPFFWHCNVAILVWRKRFEARIHIITK